MTEEFNRSALRRLPQWSAVTKFARLVIVADVRGMVTHSQFDGEISVELEAKLRNVALLFHFGTRRRQNVNTLPQDSDCVGRMTQRRIEPFQVRLGGIQNAKCCAAVPARSASCAGLTISRNCGARHVGRPFSIGPMPGEPKQRALQAADINVGPFFQGAEFFTVVERARADSRERDALDFTVPACDREKLFNA
jgi:hypothetical protein